MGRTRLEQIVEDAERTGDPWVLTRQGEPVAVLCSVETWRKITEDLVRLEVTGVLGDHVDRMEL